MSVPILTFRWTLNFLFQSLRKPLVEPTVKPHKRLAETRTNHKPLPPCNFDTAFRQAASSVRAFRQFLTGGVAGVVGSGFAWAFEKGSVAPRVQAVGSITYKAIVNIVSPGKV